MANMFDKIIEDFLKNNGGVEDDIIKAIRSLRDEAGDVDEETALELVRKLLDSMSGKDSSDDADAAPESSSSDDEIVLSDEDKLRMAENVATVKEFLEDEGYHFSTRSTRPDIMHFYLGLKKDGVVYKAKITVESAPDVCRVSVILPVVADPIYAYLLCLAIANENCNSKIGTFKYDESDGEVTFDYSFRANHGINKDDLYVYFYIAVKSAIRYYNKIRKYCIGEIRGNEIDEILEKLRDLAKALSVKE